MERAENKRSIYEFGKFLLDPHQKTLLVDGIPVHLPAKEFETLVVLVENNERALAKRELMAAVWPDTFVEEGNLAKQISALRKKIVDANGNRFIETLPKYGYRFSAADLRVTQSEADQSFILEKRTVKRVTFAVENGEGSHPPALPTSQRRLLNRWLFGILILILLSGLGYAAWGLFSRSEEAIDPYAPVRLTDNPNDDTGPVWTKDGRIRFHRVYPDNRSETWIMNADGAEQTQVKFADERTVLSWSPDEKKIQFLKPDDKTKVYVSNSDGSDEVMLPNRGGRWSADSKMIVSHQKVAEHTYDIFVYILETAELRNLTNSTGFNADPSFSPDGSKVLFTSLRDGNAEIYVMNTDGTDVRRLTFDLSTDSHAAFSPDGTQIIFTSDRENENSDVYLMNADGGNPIKFTDWDKSNETAGPGGWSSDGTKIAFFSDRNGKDDIYVASAESSRPSIVLSDLENNLHNSSFSPDGKHIAYSLELGDKTGELRILDRDTGRTRLIRKTELPETLPAWSPDGKRIAFVDRVNGNSEVCAVNSDGSGFANLTNDSSLDTNPSWSPDGMRLVFVSNRGLGAVQLYTMDADGTKARPLTPRKGWEGGPFWSPDGSSIVFACDRNDSPGNVLDICEIDVDGSREKRVLFRRDHDSGPAVSLDGTRVAFVALSDGNPEIYVMNRDGARLQRLTRDAAEDTSPSWSPDGRRLVFTSNRSGRFAIYEIEMP